MTRRVRLLFFTQTLDCEMCPETRKILDELPPLSYRISIEEANLILDTDRASAFGVDRAPAIAITYEDNALSSAAPASNPDAPIWADSRIRFLGAPAGYAFISLVRAVLIAGGQPLTLSEESRGRLAAVGRPITMQVFTTPT